MAKTPIIDRKARDEVIAAFEDYLDDKITAFEFDDRLQEIESNDETVNGVINAAWFYYDDCKDHKVTLSKQEWDYFQRLLLILRSDTKMSSQQTKRWSWDHIIAWIALALFLAGAFVVGWGDQLALLATPFGVISMLITRYRQRTVREASPNEIACTPCDSYSQIRWLRRQVPAFQKRRYRREIEGRKIRSRAEGSFGRIYAFLVWLVLGPVVLLFQGFPSIENYTFTLTKP